ncbi:hypothetical protein [Paenibacillus polymyxa]|uniref:hypothetical protein n=1 Tax=Paenibacillus polymyxa TaxID=1406 RepID=UPI000589BD23|nr:hypothetical protein [Paenibacillus polymyxa]AJE54257.1 hypothetical protein RE92_25035 [Paenibacillus polymyxa]
MVFPLLHVPIVRNFLITFCKITEDSVIIVGKHSCLVYLSASKKLLIRSPKEANKYAEFVQDGAILFKKEVLKKVRFTDRSIADKDV